MCISCKMCKYLKEIGNENAARVILIKTADFCIYSSGSLEHIM